MLHSLVFFFSSRRRHTRSLCDWSSDVCSSDLFLQTPIMTSFLHRSFLGFLLSVGVMVLVSLLTQPPPRECVEGVCFEWSGSVPGQCTTALHDYRTWGVILAITVITCWIVFR